LTDLKPETLLAQAAGADDPATGGIIPPLQPSTTFLRDPDNAYRRGFDYARDRNPTLAPAEAVLAALEGGAEALLFASGMAAATAVFQALRPGDHVVAPRVIYWGLRKWLLETAPAGGWRWSWSTRPSRRPCAPPSARAARASSGSRPPPTRPGR
jgi:cystathionine gamma-synthase